MAQLKRRDFIRYASAGLGAGIAATMMRKANEVINTRGQVLQYPTGYNAVVYGDLSSGYTALANDGSVLFQGTCQQGSGTCGIYEAIQYVLGQGYGKIGLLGNFYPISSPLISEQDPQIWLDGYASINLSQGSFHFFLSIREFLSPTIQPLWYQDVGVVNDVLSKRWSFSQDPYVFFDSTSSLIFANGNQAIGTPSAFTVSAWIQGGSNNNGGYAVSYGSTEKGKVWSINLAFGNVYFNSLSAPIPSSPFHVAAVYDNGASQLYLNGRLVASGSMSLSYVSPAYLWIGNLPIQSQQGGILPVNGKGVIENVQIYNTALTSSQIAQLASSPTQDPVSYPSLIFWALYRYIFYMGDLVTGYGFQRMGALLESGVF